MKHVKIFLPFPKNSENFNGECVWAKQVTDNTARIDNHPVGTKWHGIKAYDLVEFKPAELPTNAEFQIVKLLEKLDKT